MTQTSAGVGPRTGRRSCPGGTGAAATVVLTALVWIVPVAPQLAAARTRIDDPAAFVSSVYRRLTKNEASIRGRPYEPPADVYTPRLKALFAEYKRRSKGEAGGCLDFLFWVNGQDWILEKVRVTGRDVEGHTDRRTVVATFTNMGKAQELHFEFERTTDGWLLDEVQSHRQARWVLSDLLKCPGL